MSEEFLPKPQVDLPLPEKELSAPATEPAVVKNETPEHHGKPPVLKFLMFGVIAVLILAALGGAYVMGQNKSNQTVNTTALSPSPTPADPTADWKTYTGNGFSFKYPTNFELHDEESHVFGTDNKYTPTKNHVELNSPTAGVIPFITIDYSPTKLSLPEFIDAKSTCVEISSKTLSATKVDNTEGAFLQNTRCDVAGTSEVYVIKDGVGYKIVFQGDSNELFFNRFLNNFKFTDSTTQSLDTSNWKTFKGQYVSFNYPATWNPKNAELCCGAILEDISLGIPDSNTGPDMILGFSDVEFSQIKIDDAISKTPIRIGGKDGFKYVRKSDNSTSYDYFTTGPNNKDSFGVHVTVSVENKVLELELDNLVKTIKFN